jgi:hypothetical protein
MAGLGYKDFTAGAVLTSAQVDGYLMEQSVMNFAGTAARGSALASVLSAGQMAHVGGGTVTVYDGSAWQQVYPATSGMVFVAGTAFSAASSVSVNNCFTSAYANYRILWSGTASNVQVGIYYRSRVGGSDNTSSNYNYIGQYVSDTPAIALDATVTTTFFQVGSAANVTGIGQCTMDVFGPQILDYTSFMSNYTYRQTASKNSFGLYGGNMTVTTSYDGFTLYPSAGTFTGTVRVYGYRNS